MMNKSDSAWDGLFGIAMMVGIFFAGVFLTQRMWELFVVPTGVSPMSFWHAFGFRLLISSCTFDGSEYKKEKSSYSMLIGTIVLGYGFIWGLGEAVAAWAF